MSGSPSTTKDGVSEPAPEAHRLHPGDACRVECHHRPVSYHDVVRLSRRPITLSIAALNRRRACSAVSVPSTSWSGLSKSCSTAASNSSCVGKYGTPSLMVLLQSLRGPDGNSERGGDDLRRFDRLGLLAGPDHGRAEVTKSGRQELRPATADLVELPSRCRLLGLYLGLRVPYQYEPTQQGHLNWTPVPTLPAADCRRPYRSAGSRALGPCDGFANTPSRVMPNFSITLQDRPLRMSA